MSFKVGDKVQWIGNGECGNYVDPNIYTVSKVVPAGFEVTGNGVHDVFYTNNETASFKLVEPGPNQVIEELQKRLAEQDAAADHDHDYLAELERKLNRAVQLQKSAEARVAELIAEREAWKRTAEVAAYAFAETLVVGRSASSDFLEKVLDPKNDLREPSFVSGCAGPSTSATTSPWCSALNPCNEKCYPSGTKLCWCVCHEGGTPTDPGNPC